MLLAGKVAIVTGGARGIGACIVRQLAAHGAAVAINYSGSEARALALAAEIEAGGGRAIAVHADVRDAAAVERMVQAVEAAFGRVDGVINNAIAGAQMMTLADATDADYANMLDFGCYAVLNTVRACRPIMCRQGGGRIVNIVTELWNTAAAGWTPYLAGKGAMVGISRSLAAELGPENITVNMVAPGWMADEKVEPGHEASHQYAAILPLRRQGSADEIGNACVFFLSDLAGFVTGSYMPVMGGRIAQTGS